MAYSAFFQPADGWVGDVIPIEVDGEFWLFYLLERREDPKPGTPWALVTTKDFRRFGDRGIAAPTRPISTSPPAASSGTTAASTTSTTPGRTRAASVPTAGPCRSSGARPAPTG